VPHRFDDLSIFKDAYKLGNRHFRVALSGKDVSRQLGLSEARPWGLTLTPAQLA
jgi:hypothetical protein